MAKRFRRRSIPRKPVWATVLLSLIGAIGVWLKGSAEEATPAKEGRPDSPTVAAGKPAKPAGKAAAKTKVDTLRRAIDNREREVWVDGRGTLVKLLPDDREGDRHQRLLVRLDEGDTILIAHNIDVAPRVKVDEGDEVTFKGEFVWNDRGGVVHWTHHDPQKRRTGGWVKARGKTYQ
jgi:hypothetical protein